ncbi:MAG: O-antigen ligase family protein [Myxococcota bacterium]
MGARFSLTAAASSALMIATIAFGHELFGARSLFGVYEPRYTNPTLLAPVVNANHFGGFLAFGAALWLGLAATADDRRERFIGAGGGALCALGALGSGSRGAALSLALGFALATWPLLRARRGRARGVAVGATVVVLVGMFFAFTGYERFSNELERGDYSKLDLISRSFALSLERPLVGVGRGGFEAAFARAGESGVRFTHAENLVAQWTSEWGWPFALLALATLVLWLVRGYACSPRVEVSVAMGALLALLVHEQFDFALELLGVLSVAAFVMGAVGSGSRSPTAERSWRPFAVGALAAVGLAALGFWASAERTEARLDGRDLEGALRRELILHPVLPQVSLAVALRLRDEGDGRAMRFLNHTMALAPAWSSPHASAAYLLASRASYGQGLLEAAEAERRRSGSTGELLCALAERVPVEEAARLASVSGAGERYFASRVAGCLSSAALVEFDRILTGSPGDVPAPVRDDARVRRAARAFRAGDPEQARQELEAIPQDRRRLREQLRYAEVVGALEGAAVGLDLLEAVTAPEAPAEGVRIERSERWAYLRARARLESGLDSPRAMEATLSDLRRLAAGRASLLSDVWAFGASLYERRNETGDAFGAYERAIRLAPEARRHRWALVAAARRAGALELLQEQRRALCALGDARACDR